MLIYRIEFIILIIYAGLVSSLFENFLRNCPTFTVFTVDSLQNSETSRIVLELVSTEIITPRMIIAGQDYSGILPHFSEDSINFIITHEGNFTGLLTLMQQLSNDAKIVFVLPFGSSMESINICVQWCWTHKIVNVIIAVAISKMKFDLYTYDPFPSIQVRKIPNNATFDELFPKRPNNFQNFTVRTLRKYDYPRIFEYINLKGEEVYGGYVWKILYTWALKYNVQLEFVNVSGSVLDRTRTKEYMAADLIDIVPHLIPRSTAQNLENTYPVLFTRVCIMAPQSQRLPAYSYLYVIFDPSVWYYIIGGVVYISAAEFVYNIVALNRFDFSLAFCNTILGLTYQATNQKYFNFRSFKFIHGQVMFLGFILTNLFISNLLSFLTAILFHAQIETFEDLEMSGKRILIEEEAYEVFINLGTIPSKWQKLYDPVHRETFLGMLYSWNNSVAYSLTSDRFRLIALIQKPLKKPIFHVTNICVYESMAGLTIRDDAVFMDSINSFIKKIYEVGLHQKWVKDLASESIEAGIVKPFQIDLEPFMPLDMEHFELSWFLLGFGFLIAFACFLIERLIKFIQHK